MAEDLNVTVGGSEPGAGNATGDSNQSEQESVSYTQEDFNKALQSETDKRVSQALKTQKEQLEGDFEKRLKSELENAEKRAKMSAEELARADFEEERKSFEAERTRHNAEKLQFECAKQLGEAGLPVGFAELLTGKDEEAIRSNIKTFSESFSKAVMAEVEERIKGKAPDTGNKNTESDPFLKGFGG